MTQLILAWMESPIHIIANLKASSTEKLAENAPTRVLPKEKVKLRGEKIQSTP